MDKEKSSNETNCSEPGKLWEIGDEVPTGTKKSSPTTQSGSHTDEKGDR